MDRWKLVFGACAVALVAVFLTFALTVSFLKPVPQEQEKTTQIKQLISRYFVDDYDVDALDDAAAEAMVAATGDPWSYYVSAGEYDAFYEQQTNSYQGIGVMVELHGEDCVITEVRDGSPALAAGILPGDVLTEAGGVSVRGMTIDEIKDLVRGPAGTSIRLVLQRDGEPYETDAIRAAITHNVVYWDLLEDGIGYVEIENFDDSSAEQTSAALDDLISRDAKGIVFDVRFNPGGEQTELVRILDRILPEGELFHSVDYRGREETDYSDAIAVDLPMAVLINENSYSAAEFFAAALQEYDWAQIVGEKTVGKGNFQQVFPLRDGSAVALSVGKYFTPKGVSLSETGVTPDVSASLTEEQTAKLYYGRLPYEEDPQLQAALTAVRQQIGK